MQMLFNLDMEYALEMYLNREMHEISVNSGK